MTSERKSAFLASPCCVLRGPQLHPVAGRCQGWQETQPPSIWLCEQLSLSSNCDLQLQRNSQIRAGVNSILPEVVMLGAFPFLPGAATQSTAPLHSGCTQMDVMPADLSWKAIVLLCCLKTMSLAASLEDPTTGLLPCS